MHRIRALVLAIALAPIPIAAGLTAAATAGESDPNLPRGKGLVMLAPNPLGATAVAYAYQEGDIPTALTVGFPAQYRGMVYLGFNAEGTWFYDRDEVYILKGTALKRSPVTSVARVPNGLRNPSPQYLADHTGTAGAKTVPAAPGKYAEDPNLPLVRGVIALQPNPYGIKTLTYHYPSGPKAPPLVETGTTFPSYLGYLGYNDDGTWFSGGYVLKGDLLMKLSGSFTANMLPLGLKNPQPEYFERFVPPQVLYRNLYGTDPNIPKSVGVVWLDPNPLGAQAVGYLFFADPILAASLSAGHESPFLSIRIKDTDIGAEYLGHNDAGTWIQADKIIYVLNGKQLSVSKARSADQTPGDLKDGSMRYTAAHNLPYSPVGAPLAMQPVTFEEDPNGTTWLSYTLRTLQPNGLPPVETPLRFNVRRPAANAVPPAGLPPVVIRPANNGTWIWVGEGAQAGHAGLFYYDGPLVWILLSPDQAAQYLRPGP